MRLKMITGIATLLAGLLAAPQVNACTNYLITKSASTDGSTMISYAADSHTLFGELYHWPAKKYKPGTMLKIYEWDTGKYMGEIKQAAETYNVVGNMNEFQVAIGETTYGGREELGKQSGAVMDYGSLIYLALQRAKTARQAIRIITELMDEHGYASSGESFSVSDPNEVWILEIIGKGEGEKGAVWVAMLIPDGYVSGHANHARITTFPYQKTNNFDDPKAAVFNAPDVITFARKKGWYDGPDAEFSFSDTYAPIDFGGARFCEIRVYSMFHKVSKAFKDNPAYWEYVKGNIQYGKHGYPALRMPLWIKPDQKVSVHDMMMFMRDHLEGTELDMSLDIGAGPYGVPYRWRPMNWQVDGQPYLHERATATQQTGFSFIAQSRGWLPREIGGIFWFGVDDASSCVYTPMYTSMTKTPQTWAAGNGAMMEWSDNAAFWVFNQISNFAYTRYNLIHPEIADKQLKAETGFIEQVALNDKKWKDLSPKKMVAEVTKYSVTNGDNTVYEWKKFYQYLFMKYMDGNVKTAVEVPSDHIYIPAKVQQPGYPEFWYRLIIEKTGDKLKVTTPPAH
ncbi:MAG TPA: C69 family dipeptidase [Bacteroidales bacterium]|nr:C69 family dipeptidase [Bacteroidales bacterium]HRZ49300.1 C69 family dipeptidase [Bacteroidales bacterium]